MLELARSGELKSRDHIVRLYAPLVHWWCRKGFPPWRDTPGLPPVPCQDAADVDQEVFLTVFKRIRRFTKDGKPAAFRRWLYAITFYEVLEYWKNRSPEFDGRGGDESWIDKLADRRLSPDASEKAQPAPPPVRAADLLEQSPPPLAPDEVNPERMGPPATGIRAPRLSFPEGNPATKSDLARVLESIRPDWYAFWQQVVEERSVEEVAKELGIQPDAVATAVTRVSRHLREVALDGVPVRILLLRRLIDLIRLEFEDRTFQAFWMVAAEERSAQAVADLLDMPVSTVHGYKARVLNKLKQELKALELLLPNETQVAVADGAPVTQSEVKL
jgi:RNA polymerase sigma factor (sigma-70 family)